MPPARRQPPGLPSPARWRPGLHPAQRPAAHRPSIHRRRARAVPPAGCAAQRIPVRRTGRLIGATLPDGRQVHYRYDAFGRRIAKTLDGRTTELLWQGERLIAESAPGHYRSYIYEPGERALTSRPLPPSTMEPLPTVTSLMVRMSSNAGLPFGSAIRRIGIAWRQNKNR
ncbi:hypothetical protein BZL42_12865 [Pseudomonas indica]|nr:hypothetical protein BZL42_12865 [Pseudomonas indica]